MADTGGRPTAVMSGDASVFAVEAELGPATPDRYVLVRTRLWIAGSPLGDFDDPVVLSAVVGGLTAFAESADARHPQPFADGSAKDVLSRIWQLSYGDRHDGDRSASASARRYVVSEVSLNLLDHRWRIVSVRYIGHERFIWDRGDGTTLEEQWVPAKRVDRAIETFRNWAADQTKQHAQGHVGGEP